MIRLSIILVVFQVLWAFAGETNGSVDLGYWYVKNNLLDQPNALADDGVGQNFLQSDYALLMMGIRLNSNDIFSNSDKKTNFHFRTKALSNFSNSLYTQGIDDRWRFEFKEANFEFEEAFTNTDLWVGRQTILAAGAARFDGVQFLFHLNDQADLGLYGGLGQNPRSQTGYIGPDYVVDYSSFDFIHSGLYTSYRKDRLQFDLGLHSEFFEGKIDRIYHFFTGNLCAQQQQSNWNAHLHRHYTVQHQPASIFLDQQN